MSTRGAGRQVGDWVIVEQVGSGSFAVVWRARRLGNEREEVAIKEIALGKLNAKLKESLESEVSILKQISHPNIVRLVEVLKEEEQLYLVMEYCAGKDLAALLRKRSRLPEAEARGLMQQLSSGLQQLWSRNLVHRDLKPQNILLSSSGPDAVLKIADFGFARSLQPQGLAETLCGSPLYMAPEILQFHKYDAKADLWSVGTILYELLVGRPPFSGANHVQLLRNIERGEARIPAGLRSTLSFACCALLQGLLRKNPVERLSFQEFFQHPFLTGQELPRDVSPASSTRGFDMTYRAPEGLAKSPSRLRRSSGDEGEDITSCSPGDAAPAPQHWPRMAGSTGFTDSPAGLAARTGSTGMAPRAVPQVPRGKRREDVDDDDDEADDAPVTGIALASRTPYQAHVMPTYMPATPPLSSPLHRPGVVRGGVVPSQLTQELLPHPSAQLPAIIDDEEDYVLIDGPSTFSSGLGSRGSLRQRPSGDHLVGLPSSSATRASSLPPPSPLRMATPPLSAFRNLGPAMPSPQPVRSAAPTSTLFPPMLSRSPSRAFSLPVRAASASIVLEADSSSPPEGHFALVAGVSRPEGLTRVAHALEESANKAEADSDDLLTSLSLRLLALKVRQHALASISPASADGPRGPATPQGLPSQLRSNVASPVQEGGDQPSGQSTHSSTSALADLKAAAVKAQACLDLAEAEGLEDHLALPDAWGLTYENALSSARSAAVEELLGNAPSCKQALARAGALLFFLCSEAPQIDAPGGPLGLSQHDASRLQRLAAAVCLRFSAVDAKHGPQGAV